MRWSTLGLTLLLLLGIGLMVVGLTVAVDTISLCGFGSRCSSYLIIGIDPWAVAFATADLGVLTVVWTMNRTSGRR